MKPIISLYILNHNYGEFLEEAIESALNQTFSNYEIIIVDDASTDNSFSILDNYISNPNIRIYKENNKSLTKSANRAIRESNGDYICRLDADDILAPNVLQVLYNHITDDKSVAYVFPGYFETNSKGKITQSVNRGEKPFAISTTDIAPHGACSLIRKSLLVEKGCYNESVACRDGLDLFLKMRDDYKIVAVPDFLFYYRKHNRNLTNNKSIIKEGEDFLLKK